MTGIERELSLVVSEDESGSRVDTFLARNVVDMTRSYIQTLIDEGLVLVDGKKVKASTKVKEGSTVTVAVPPPKVLSAEPEPMDLAILYEDDDVLIVNKPKGMTVHPAPGSPDHTLVNGILWHCRGQLSGINGVLRPGIVHRIDKDTTGALIVCKNDKAHQMIAAQLERHSITRKYRGICLGNIKNDVGIVDGNIGRNPRDRKKMAVVKSGGKHAVTHYRVLERYGTYTYCEFELETGRTHQIRVHMASIGHPLLGDSVYGPARCPYPLHGQTLHAMVIGFIHPTTGEYMQFQAPLPDYFNNLLIQFRRKAGIQQ